MYGTKTVYREQKDSSGTSIGMDKHVEATVEGRVLMAAGEPVKDRFDRLYVGIPIEAEPGFDRYVQSADPLIHEQLLSLAKGDVVRAKGVLQSSKRGNSEMQKALSFGLKDPKVLGHAHMIAEKCG